MNDTAKLSEGIGAPFPLLKIFGLVLLPLLVIAGFGLGAAMITAMSASAENLFAHSDVRLLGTIVPRSSNGTIVSEPTKQQLEELRRETIELGLTCLSVVAPAATYTIRASEHTECSEPNLTELRHEIEEEGALLVEDLILPSAWTSLGTVDAQPGRPGAIIAATRPATSFEASIFRSAGVWATIFASLILLVC